MNTSTGYFYDAKFEEYILTVGQTGCAKTTFVQKLVKSKMFGDIMDDIQGLADKSENFANFLTVSRKFTYVYIFHTIYPTRNNWQMIQLEGIFLPNTLFVQGFNITRIFLFFHCNV